MDYKHAIALDVKPKGHYEDPGYVVINEGRDFFIDETNLVDREEYIGYEYNWENGELVKGGEVRKFMFIISILRV